MWFKSSPLVALSLIVILSVGSQSSHALLSGEAQEDIDRVKLEQLLETCTTDVLCYRNGIKSVLGMEVDLKEVDEIVTSAHDSGGDVVDISQSDFTCHKNERTYSLKFDKEGLWVDHYKNSRSEDMCRISITMARTNGGLICATHGANDRYFIKKLVGTLKKDGGVLAGLHEKDPFDTLEECNSSLQSRQGSIVCLSGNNGKYARYDFEKDVYLDLNYEKSFDACVADL